MMSSQTLRFGSWSAVAALAALVSAGAAAATLTWSGGSATWDTTSYTWNGGTAKFTNGDDVVFPSGTNTITVTAGLLPNSTTVSGGDVTFNGSIAGGTLIQTLNSIVRLNNVNSFSSVNASTCTDTSYLMANVPGALGTGPIALGPAVRIYGDQTINAAVSFSGNTRFQGASWIINGPVDLTTGERRLALGGTVTINGKVSNGSIGVSNEFGNTLTLTNDANDFTGRVWPLHGSVAFTSIANAGTASALGTGTSDPMLLFGCGDGGGQFTYIGTLPAGHSSSRPLYLSNYPAYPATIAASGIGPLTLTGTITGQNNVNRTLVLAGTNTGNNTLGSGIPDFGTGVASLTKSDPGKWLLTVANTYTGNTTASRGELVLAGAGTVLNTAALSLDRGTLTLDNTGTNTADRVKNAAPVTVTGGTLKFLGNTAASSSESLGALIIGAGAGTINVANGTSGATAATLTFNGITRLANGSVNFTATNGALGAGGNNPGVVLIGAANDATGILGAWATVGGSDWASIGASGVQAYSGYGSLSSGVGGPIIDTLNSRLTASQTQVGTVTTNSLKVAPAGAGQSLAIGANNLTLTGGALLLTGNDYTIGGSGTLRAPAGKDLTLSTETGRTLTISALVAGDTGLNKTGAGTVVLGNSGNSYTGGTNIYQGTLQGDVTSLKGAVFLDVGTSVVYNQTADGTLASTISGSGSLGKTGAATLKFTSPNTFTGGTTLSGGTLEYTNTAMSGNGPFGTGTIAMANGTKLFRSDTSGGQYLANPIAIANGATVDIVTYGPNNNPVNYSGVISGGTLANPVTINFRGDPGGQSLPSLGTANTFVGHVVSSDNELLIINGPASLGAATNDLTIMGLAWPPNHGLRVSPTTGTVPQSIAVNDMCNFTSNGALTTFTGNITNAGNNGTVFLSGGGEMVFSGTNSPYMWEPYNSSGTVTFTTPASMGASAIFAVGYAGYDFNLKFSGAGTKTFPNNFSGAGNNKTMTVIVDDAAETVSLTGGFSFTSPNQVNIAKAGPGILNLSGSVNNTGTTTVSAGTLNVNVTTAVNQGSYTVASGAALGGTGNIRLAAGASVTNNGTITPGTSPGTLTVTGGNVVFASGSTLREEIGGLGAGQFDALTVTGGTLNLSATGDILDITTLAPYYSNIGDSVRFLNAAATTGTFDILRWNGWTTNSVYTVSYDAGGATLQFLVSIPEPASVLLLAGAALLACRRRRG